MFVFFFKLASALSIMSKSFFFIFVKSYSISPVRLQRIMKKSFVPLLITYLITLSLEKKTGKSLEFCIQLKSVPTLGMTLTSSSSL